MKKIVVILLLLGLAGMAWAQRSKTIPKLYTSQRLRLPNVTSCPTASPTPREGEICWDKDDDVLKVWNGSSYTSVSTPTGSFAVNTGDTFSGVNNFTGSVNFTTAAPAMGNNTDADAALWRMNRSTPNGDIELFWDESAAALEFDWDGDFDNGEDVTITTDTLSTPLLVVGGGDAAEDITITFDDSDVDMALTWDDSVATLEFDFDGALADKADVTITTSLLQAPAVTLGIGTASDVTLTFDNDDADPTLFWDDSADVLAVTGAGLKLATCTIATATSIDAKACSVMTPTGSTQVDTVTTCGVAQEGWVLYVMCASATAVFKDAAGNMQLAGDFTCAADDVLTLICEGSTGDWLEVTRSVN